MLQVSQNSVMDDKVAVSTIHRAKGLEWDVVFVTRAMENVLPLPFRPTNSAWPLQDPPMDTHVGPVRPSVRIWPLH